MDFNTCQSWKTAAVVLAVVLPLVMVALAFSVWHDYRTWKIMQQGLGRLEWGLSPQHSDNDTAPHANVENGWNGLRSQQEQPQQREWFPMDDTAQPKRRQPRDASAIPSKSELEEPRKHDRRRGGRGNVAPSSADILRQRSRERRNQSESDNDGTRLPHQYGVRNVIPVSYANEGANLEDTQEEDRRGGGQRYGEGGPSNYQERKHPDEGRHRVKKRTGDKKRQSNELDC